MKTVPRTGPGASQFPGAKEQLGPREPGECPGSHVEEGHPAEGGGAPGGGRGDDCSQYKNCGFSFLSLYQVWVDCPLMTHLGSDKTRFRCPPATWGLWLLCLESSAHGD